MVEVPPHRPSFPLHLLPRQVIKHLFACLFIVHPSPDSSRGRAAVSFTTKPAQSGAGGSTEQPHGSRGFLTLSPPLPSKKYPNN